MPTDAVWFRAAMPADAAALAALGTGHIAGKGRFIEESIRCRNVIVACTAAGIAGYLIWDRAFFGRPFVWLLGVDRRLRRRGIATRLMREFVSCCRGEALFTSTNESNQAMRVLLAGLGFEPSGRVENIDPGDPELFFYMAAGA